MPKHAKGPPRYVPTLTDVVPEGWVAAGAVPGPDRAEAGMETDRQAKPVPAVQVQEQAVRSDPGAAECFSEKPSSVREHKPEEGPVAACAQVLHAAAAPSSPAGVSKNWLPEGLEEALVHRVMQRVDIALDQRVRAAIATVVQEQTRFLLPRLCEEVESIVRQVVSEAIADETALNAARTLQQG